MSSLRSMSLEQFPFWANVFVVSGILSFVGCPSSCTDSDSATLELPSEDADTVARQEQPTTVATPHDGPSKTTNERDHEALAEATPTSKKPQKPRNRANQSGSSAANDTPANTGSPSAASDNKTKQLGASKSGRNAPSAANPKEAYRKAQALWSQAQQAQRAGKHRDAFTHSLTAWQMLQPHGDDVECDKLSKKLLSELKRYGEAVNRNRGDALPMRRKPIVVE